MMSSSPVDRTILERARALGLPPASKPPKITPESMRSFWVQAGKKLMFWQRSTESAQRWLTNNHDRKGNTCLTA